MPARAAAVHGRHGMPAAQVLLYDQAGRHTARMLRVPMKILIQRHSALRGQTEKRIRILRE
jgi:hypothetical protein